MDVVFGESHVWDSVVDDGAYGYYDVINIDDVPESMVVHNSKGGFLEAPWCCRCATLLYKASTGRACRLSSVSFTNVIALVTTLLNGEYQARKFYMDKVGGGGI